ncbi:S-adenosyl-L-methionine-dependent methyltransferase [Polyplosphaeria fusca]|uniref:S-adenosyl-L-methionine-dependent methyltransferase n=1 Tax=Polyplosphaeria fusca TaxID=682080 RepID=A0A9P4QQ91_9PLEO|nr:S-adenosyl-L-methionine-dependent methyltransferase [Polyplosphaeria fusca]
MEAEKPHEYILGGSATELDRIHGFHDSTVDHIGKLVLAPVNFAASSGRRLRILDSGTAAGRWLQELRDEQGSRHEYIGTDITKSFFPSSSPHDTGDRAGEEGGDVGIVYKTQDVTQPWPTNWAASFDLVHQRFVLGAVRSQQLEDVVANLVALVKPEGWVQLMESDVGARVIGEEDNGAAVVWGLLRKIYLTMGVEPDVDAHLPALFTRAGLVDVSEQRITVPIGKRRVNADMGRRSAETVALTAQQLAMGAKQVGVAGLEELDLHDLPSKVLRDLEDYGGTYSVYVIMGRKP